jgi:hypothetical protein
MLILHDRPSADLSHVNAIAKINEGFALFDYVRIDQADGDSWIGQIVQPNQNISTVGDPLDPTILHGLELMQRSVDVQSVESVQVFDILILGQYDSDVGQLLTPRLRPLPGAKVERLSSTEVAAIIELPRQAKHADGSTNVIGELLNAEDVVLCVDGLKFNYHIMVAGGTGSGKSNVAANLVLQGTQYGKCVLVHDAKPDYGLIDRPNSDKRVARIWPRFERFGLKPCGARDVTRIGFHGKCDPTLVDEVVGFRSCDFNPGMLAGLFFPGSSTPEQNAYEGFAMAAFSLRQEIDQGSRKAFTLDDILTEVDRRDADNGNVAPRDAIHHLTAVSIARKVGSRRGSYPWLDAVDKPIGGRVQGRFRSGTLDGQGQRKVAAFSLESVVQAGRIIVLNYQDMDEGSYAVLVSYFLRQCQSYRRKAVSASQLERPGVVQLVDEAHRIFDNESRHGGSLGNAFERVMREGRSVDHSIILSLQNASQIPPRVMNNLNTKIVMRQNGREEADAATQTMGKEFAIQAMRLGTGHALVSMHESRATVLVQMAPAPFELVRSDATRVGGHVPAQTPAAGDDELPF